MVQALALGAFILSFRQATEVLNLAQCLPTAFVTVAGEKGREGYLQRAVQILDDPSCSPESSYFCSRLPRQKAKRTIVMISWKSEGAYEYKLPINQLLQ